MPNVLWIGCSDSRAPETTICGCDVGDIFTHRDIANLVQPTDDSVQSVIAYAVKVVKVKHIIVVGHYQCGGVKAAWEASKRLPDDVTEDTPINRWLAPLALLSKQLGLYKKSQDTALPELTGQSVGQQVDNVTKIPLVKEAMNDGKLWVHGWIFDLNTGELSRIER